MITAEIFKRSFICQWGSDWSDEREVIVDAFQRNNTWTTYMLGREKQEGFFHRLNERLQIHVPHLTFARGYYYIDGVYGSYESLYHAGWYPARLDVILEHENQVGLETEMYKLLMFRSPLKVLVFYDYVDPNTDARRGWRDEQLRVLGSMIGEVNDAYPEANETDYLLIVGTGVYCGPILKAVEWDVYEADTACRFREMGP